MNRPTLERSPSSQLVRSLNRRFLGHTRFLVASSAFIMLLFFSLVFYSINSDFDLFIELSKMANAQITRDLMREQNLLNFLGLSSFVLLMSFLYFFTRRTFSQLTKELASIENHLGLLRNGKLDIPYISALGRSKDFEDLVVCLDQLHLKLIEETQADIQNLKKIRPREEDHASQYLLQQMIQEKKLQLGIRELYINNEDDGNIIPFPQPPVASARKSA